MNVPVNGRGLHPALEGIRRSAKKNGLRHLCCNPLILLAEWTGLEPATPGVTGRGQNLALARVCG